jgi:hypothetical protein
MLKKTIKLLVGFVCVYGSVVGIGYLTDWGVSVLLLTFAIGHNMDKH